MEKSLVQELIKQVLPSYDIKDLLGEGSYGAVYRIKDSLKERAAKVIQLNASASIENGGVTSGEVKIERDFRHIIDNYEKIACDEIVTVYDFYKVFSRSTGNQSSAYAIVVMELYPHNLLDFMMEHFKKHKSLLDVEVVENIGIKLAEMLSNLYTKRGFLFEDLKPENLLVKYQDGEYKVVVGDIGGLKSLRSVSATGSQVTLSYCAAEVIRGKQKPDIKSIIYSFGLIMYYILEGHLPYEDVGVSERIDMIRDKGLVFSRTDVPLNLRCVIEKSLAFEQIDRYQNFEEVIRALRDESGGQQAIFGAKTIDLDSFMQSVQAAPEQPKPAFNPASMPSQRTAVPGNPFAGINPALSQRLGVDARKKTDSVRISSENSEAENIDAELKDLVVKPNDIQKLQNKSYRVVGDIKVENGGMLFIEGAKLFFDENSGIFSSGIIRATNSLFSAIDVKKKWANIALSPRDTRLNVFEGCKFRFGGGRSWKQLKMGLSVRNYPLNDEYTYGGGLFISESKEKLVVVNDCSFYSCKAHEGGAVFLFRAHPSVANCVIENCSSSLAGGGVSCVESNPSIKNCKFHTCSTLKEGGGMFCKACQPFMEKCSFDNCSTRYLYGGGMFCQESSPTLKDCRFQRCVSSKEGGGIYADKKSRPKMLFSSFSNCRPDNANFNIHGHG